MTYAARLCGAVVMALGGAAGQTPAGGFYTASVFIGQRNPSEEMIAKVAADLDGLAPLVKQGKIVWSSLARTAARWRTEYQGKPFQQPCLEEAK